MHTYIIRENHKIIEGSGLSFQHFAKPDPIDTDSNLCFSMSMKTKRKAPSPGKSIAGAAALCCTAACGIPKGAELPTEEERALIQQDLETAEILLPLTDSLLQQADTLIEADTNGNPWLRSEMAEAIEIGWVLLENDRILVFDIDDVRKKRQKEGRTYGFWTDRQLSSHNPYSDYYVLRREELGTGPEMLLHEIFHGLVGKHSKELKKYFKEKEYEFYHEDMSDISQLAVDTDDKTYIVSILWGAINVLDNLLNPYTIAKYYLSHARGQIEFEGATPQSQYKMLLRQADLYEETMHDIVYEWHSDYDYVAVFGITADEVYEEAVNWNLYQEEWDEAWAEIIVEFEQEYGDEIEIVGMEGSEDDERRRQTEVKPIKRGVRPR